MIVPKDQREKRKRGAGTGGRFFVLDKDQWNKVWKAPTRNRLNLALSYLVMLAGTGADHRLSKWSTAAINRHTGMRKEAARAAVDELIASKLATRASGWTASHPQYELSPARPKAGAEVTPIFLPVGLVTGVAGSDVSILCRLREAGDPLLLRMLIDFYGFVTTDAPVAMSLNAMRTEWGDESGAEKAFEAGAHTVWELAEPKCQQSIAPDRSLYLAKGDEADTYWERVRKLEKMGALCREDWLYSNASADADPIFPLFGTLGEWATDAARQILSGPEDERAWKSDDHPGRLVVLPSHHQAPAIQRVMKMRIEADTPGRRAAYGERMRMVAHWTEQYGQLMGEVVSGVFSNPLRTQPSRVTMADRPHQGDQGDQGLSRVSSL